ncbi:YolD-like protein [Paenibacillus darwinianus]|uniref:YolD-like protein n=1 Tax=Paenibacillus darwinianus TaxID=1380763 RepID=A0A9W5W6A3_9BACL|nr:YolD-like family protein [Paenibacillus darwinianus]EXX85879.1 YolD-like protein [Paenibacillus darwinianus]EXX86115.1 YolD-like protein [Paenibacillus darwinianus]EXX86216.1 YolD-like protein [Paenibacillus darwinianus]
MAKENKLTTGSNLLWEGSRMMLPEHKERHVRHRQGLTRRERAELDESEWERIGRMMADSVQQGISLRIALFDAYEDREVIGVVDRVDRRRGRFLVAGRWYNEADIQGVEEG